MKFTAAVVATVTLTNAAAEQCSMDTSWAEGMRQVCSCPLGMIEDCEISVSIVVSSVLLELSTQIFHNGGWPTGPVGSTTQLIIDAADAAASGIEVVDGMSGDTRFPHGNFKPLAVSTTKRVRQLELNMLWRLT